MANPEVLKNYKTVDDTVNEAFFFPDSMVIEKAPRLLVVGTKAEVRKLREEYGDEFGGLNVDYCSSIHSFKKTFLGNDYVGHTEKMILPEKIVTTGYIRADVHFSETLCIMDKLKAVSEKYQIPIEELEPFHL